MLERSQRIIPTLIHALSLLLILAYSFEIGRATGHQQEREQIKTINKANNRVYNNSASDGGGIGPDNPPSKPYTDTGRNETSEVALFGVRTGEGLLVVVTLLLFGATYRLVTGQNEHSMRQLRAYVGIDHAEIRIEDGKKLVAIAAYKNAGQTPAHDVELRLSAKVLNFANQFDWQNPDTIEDEGKGGVILPYLIWTRHLSKIKEIGDDPTALIRALEDGKKRVWMWGTISYRDIFQKRCFVQFSFWSSKVRRSENGREWFATIPEIANIKATYGED
jgi:hypothetical protein